MMRGTKVCMSLAAVLCLHLAAWGQAETPAGATTPEVAPEQDSDEPLQVQEPNELIEISRPAEALKSILSKEYLARIVSAQEAPPLTSVEQRASLELTLDHLNARMLEPAVETWARCASEFIERSGQENIENLILYILNEAYLQSDPDLLMHAEKARFFNEQEDVVHEHLSALRKFESARGSSGSPEATIEKPVLSPYVPGGAVVRSFASEQVSREELETRIETWERTLLTLEEDTRLANSELQRTMSKQRVVVQDMSAASEMLHEVAKRIAASAPKEEN